MRTAAAFGLAGLLLAGLLPFPRGLPGAMAQEGPAPEAAAAEIPPVPPRNPPPPDPTAKVRKDIDGPVKEFFENDPPIAKDPMAAKGLRALLGGKIQTAVMAWNAAIGNPGALRRVDWWKARLHETYTTANVSTSGKVSREEFVLLGTTKIPLAISLPKTYKGSGPLFPVILTVIDKGADPKKTLEAAYGDLLNSHIVVANFEEGVGTVPAKMLWGLMYVFGKYRADRDRVVLDGLGKGSRFVDVLAPDSPIYFNGAVFRAPGTVSPVVANMGLFPCAAVLPAGAPSAIVEAAAALKAACPEYREFAAADPPRGLQDWIAALPPRRIVDPKTSYTWWTRTVGRKLVMGDGLWFGVSGFQDSGTDKVAMVRIARDPARNLIDLDCKWVSDIVLFLNDEVVDLDHPVYVRVNGVLVHTEKKPVRKVEHSFHYDLGKFADPLWPRELLVTCVVRVSIPEEARLTREERAALRKAEDRANGGVETHPPPPAEAPGPAEPPKETAPKPETPPPAPPATGGKAEEAKVVLPTLAVFLSPKDDAPGQAALVKALEDEGVKKLLEKFDRRDTPVAEEAGIPLGVAAGTMVLPKDAPVLYALRPDLTVLGSLDARTLKPEDAGARVLRWLEEMIAAARPAPVPPTLAIFLAPKEDALGQSALQNALADEAVKKLLGKFASTTTILQSEAGVPLGGLPGKTVLPKDVPVLHVLGADGKLLGSLDARGLESAEAKDEVLRFLEAMAAAAAPKAREPKPETPAAPATPGEAKKDAPAAAPTPAPAPGSPK